VREREWRREGGSEERREGREGKGEGKGDRNGREGVRTRGRGKSGEEEKERQEGRSVYLLSYSCPRDQSSSVFWLADNKLSLSITLHYREPHVLPASRQIQ